MKILLAGLLLAPLSPQAGARPGPGVVDACLRTTSESPAVGYTPMATDAFQVTEDAEAGKIDITVRIGPDLVGTWEVAKTNAFGLVFNGRQIPLARVTRLDKRKVPAGFNPYEAMWGEAHQGNKSYICVTFNFDGLGKSGSYQNIRGVYLIERGARPGSTFYTSGNTAGSANGASFPR